MAGEVRSLAAQRDRQQREKDNRNAVEVEQIRDGLRKNSSSK